MVDYFKAETALVWKRLGLWKQKIHVIWLLADLYITVYWLYLIRGQAALEESISRFATLVEQDNHHAVYSYGGFKFTFRF